MRQAAGLSQLQLAAALGIHNAVLSKMEVGTIKVPLTTLVSAAKICGFRVALLPKNTRKGAPILVEPPLRYEPTAKGQKRYREAKSARVQ